MKGLVSLLLFLLCLVGISIQQCTIEKFHESLNGFLSTPSQIPFISAIYYNCLSPSNTESQYSSMSVSVLYDSNEGRFNARCTNDSWRIMNQSTFLRNNNTRYCEDCTDQTVNDYHCTVSVKSNYYFGFFKNSDTVPLSLIITTSESQLVYYSIEAPGEGYYTSGIVTSDNEVIINLPTTLITSSHNDQDKGIHLMISSDRVTVIGQNLVDGSSGDSFFCLPTTNLSVDEYVYYGISISRSSSNDFSKNSSILVVGTENNTMLKLTVTQPVTISVSNSTVDLTAGIQCPFVINRLQTVLIGSVDDLTGTKIVTDKPVSVLSGHECGQVPADVESCDHLVEQVPPTTLWGRVYYTAPLATRTSYTIKVLAAYNSTVVDIYCNNTRECHIISEGESVTMTLSLQEYCAINSNKEVLVVQFSHGWEDDNTNEYGNPMMTLVPATNQYSNKFQISTLQGQSDYTHYINIIALTSYAPKDDIVISTRNEVILQWLPILVNDFPKAFATQLNVSKGVIEVFSNSILLTTIVYGFTTTVGYGHPGGNNFAGNVENQLPANNSNETLTKSFSSVTLLEGDTVALSCTPSIMEVNMLWTHNGIPVLQKKDVIFLLSDRNHTLTIGNATECDSGIYTCFAISDDGSVLAEQSITVKVLLACNENYSDGLLLFWEKSRINSTVTQPCSRLHPSFRFGVNIKRQCYNSGSWSSVDLSDCTMYRNSYPVVVVYFTLGTNTLDPMNSQDVVTKVSSQIKENITNPINRTQRSTTSGMQLISFALLYSLEIRNVPFNLLETVKNELNNDTDNIFPNGTVLTSSIEVLVFQPSSSCPCNVTDDNSIRTVCIGPSTPPCLCSSQSYTCNNLTYAGDGNVCGLDSDSDGFPDVGLDCDLTQRERDSDSDGFPDVGLDCDLTQCERDVCRDIYSVGQNRSFCMNNTIKGFDGCHLGEDVSPWSITWPPTGRNKKAKQKCPGGSESKGFAHRKCLGNNQWESPNISMCQTVEILRFLERAKELSALYQRINSDNSDRTRTFRLKDMREIIYRLVTVINVEQPVLPNDLPTISSIMREVILVTNKIANGSLDDADLRQQIWDITHFLADVLNVLFDETNDVSFEQLTYENRTQLGEQLLDYTEHIGLLLSATLETDADMNVMDNFTHENIVVAALIPTEEHLENRSEIEFPPPQISFSLFGTRTPSMRIPARAVLKQTQKEKKRAPVINIISRNLHLATQEGKLLESLVISGEISRTPSSQINLHEGNASLRFYVPLRDNQSNATCHFFNISRNNSERGHFSQEGITSTTRDGSFVQCSSNHLTSFAILVDVSGQTNDNQSTGLKIVSYIGCAVSIVCLLIAVCMLIAFRKKIFNQEQHFLHLNLSISLLVGLVIFVSGIETASDYRTSCLIVAILLHYFFMAAFSWMLCEGILLFIMLKFVFYHGFLKSKIFFLLLGWGLPLPIVIVSAAVSHEQYGIGDAICWISEENGAIWAFIGPILLIILINSFFLVVTMHEIFKSSRGILTTSDVTKLGTAKSLVRAAIIVVPMLGITWVVGIFAINENTIAFAWIFTILNSFQGMVILFVYVLKNEKFLKMIGIQKCIEKFTRDSHPTSASARPIANTKQTEAGLSEDANIALKSRSTSLGTLCDDNTDL